MLNFQIELAIWLHIKTIIPIINESPLFSDEAGKMMLVTVNLAISATVVFPLVEQD